MNGQARRAAGWPLVFLLALPWVHPWAPGPHSNTVPLLIGWAVIGLLLAWARLPMADALARSWALAALLSSAMGLLQYFGEAQRLSGWVHVPGHLGEAMANLRQRNQLATLTSMGAVAVLWWHRQGLSPRHALWMLALLALGNAATGSRTGLLQWLVLPTLLLLWQTCASQAHRERLWHWPLLLWALGVYLLASLALPHALALWTGADVSSALARLGDMTGCGSRPVLWANVWHLVMQKPWAGWGWSELKYAHYMASYTGPRFCDILGNAHNLPLHLAFAFGLPAAALVSTGTLALVLRARPWRLQGPQDSLAWGVLALIGLHSLLEYPLWYGPFQLAMLGAVLLLWPQGRDWLLRQTALLRMAGLTTLCLVVLIGADHARMRQIYLPPAQRWALWREDPWAAARQTLFFSQGVRFAELTSTPVTTDNAPAMLQASLAMLHYSPEPRVIDKLIHSARLSGQDTLAHWHLRQKQIAYPLP